MKVSTITKTVKVTISNAQLLNLFVQAVAGDTYDIAGKERTFYKALGHLVGVSDVSAVGVANTYHATQENQITVEEFREWLPTVFAEFARVMLEAHDEKAR